MPVVERPDGAKIAYFVDGPEDGPAVLLVMGLAWPAAMWFRVVPHLADRYRVVRVDNRGAGETGDVPGAPYSVATMAGDCLAALDELGIGQVHVVGISMGGLIAQEIAVAQPHRARSLTLMATHPGIAHCVIDEKTLAFVTAGRADMTPREAAEASLPYNYAPTTPRERIEEDWDVRLPLACSPAGYAAQVQGTLPWTRFDELGAITAPTLVLHGELDTLVLPANGRAVADRIPGARFELVADANHVLMTDQPERVAGLLRAWIDGH